MEGIRFTEEQIIAVLRAQDAGAKTADVARKHRISAATLYNWKAKSARSRGRAKVRCPVALMSAVQPAMVLPGSAGADRVSQREDTALKLTFVGAVFVLRFLNPPGARQIGRRSCVERSRKLLLPLA